MPAIMIILNIVFITGIVVAIVGLCAWGIVSDRPFAAYLTERANARAQRRPAYERRRLSREHPVIAGLVGGRSTSARGQHVASRSIRGPSRTVAAAHTVAAPSPSRRPIRRGAPSVAVVQAHLRVSAGLGGRPLSCGNARSISASVGGRPRSGRPRNER